MPTPGFNSCAALSRRFRRNGTIFYTQPCSLAPSQKASRASENSKRHSPSSTRPWSARTRAPPLTFQTFFVRGARNPAGRLAPNRSAAEASLVRALEIGQARSAVGWQLRAAVPLARLWLDDGTPERARALLTELVEQFNNERDTPDVVEARNVLKSLRT